MRQVIIGFGLMILCLLVFFRISAINVMQANVRLEIVVAIASVVFFFIGLYFNYQSQRHTTTISRYEATGHKVSAIDQEQIKKTGLTQREHEVLVKMAEGLSNQEIAAALYLSESTVKTHVSNILFKLEARRRTQAIQIAKQLKIVV